VRIVKGTDRIPVEHPIMLLYGQPGIGKTSLGYSAAEALLLDFDRGAHRAANRRDTLTIETWEDVEELTSSPDTTPRALDPYRTIAVDTVGRALDVLTADIAIREPKKASGGNLSQQGWGTLKTRFRTWMSVLRSQGKDILLIAHDREDRDGDLRVARPDITGGSLGEVMKLADFVGYLSMNGSTRVLDFSPSDRWVGKNPAQWPPFKVPPVASAADFMADLFDRGRAALGQISDSSATILGVVDDWRAQIATFTTDDEINRAIPHVQTLAPIASAQVKHLLAKRAKALELVWNPSTHRFEAKAA